LIYHVWPVRGEMWRWNVEQLRSRIDLFNGKRIVSIVYDERSEDPEEVRKVLAGHGCEFIVVCNGPLGEGLTFPSMLAQVRSLDPDEVTFYAHAKGVRHEPLVPRPVRRWSEILYRTALDHWPLVRAQLERYAVTGSFKMLGRFRAHHYTGDWHYSGTFFWLRHAYIFARDVASVEGFYGCVEAWPGLHFKRQETGCLFMDELRQLPYHESFWIAMADTAFAQWQASLPAIAPPADLLNPPPFEGYATPRLEQHPEEFAWLLDELVSAAPQRMLTIGAMHGGAEWHIARRFRALGREIHITVVDVEARPELLATLEDARHRFSQPIELVVGDSMAGATRERLRQQYDAVFIDGDHSYRGARSDVDFALERSARLIALHDITDSDWHAQARCSVSRVWGELRARYSTAERLLGHWGGIGIIRP
jgi:predicted O-methyltransferase YrrM